jgi:hypothetical protein
MKKTNRKLVLRAETIRELSARSLTRIVAGKGTVDADAMPQTRDRDCGAAVAYPQTEHFMAR